MSSIDLLLTERRSDLTLKRHAAAFALKLTEILPGDIVFVRWQGDVRFEIVKKHKCNSPLPHWICKEMTGKKINYWIFPQIHMTTSDICLLIKTHNRKQLTLI